MKATDLMIGDWVQSFGEPHKIIGIRTDTPYPYIKTNMSDTWYEWGMKDLADGIPLTPEILEKNGWEIAGPSIERFYWHEDVPFCLPMCGFEHSNGRNVSSDKLFSDEFFEIVNMRLSFVHELQHALKMCGIEKEIVL